ncbi:hypothetical protein TNCV_3692651 [Trichonephila clavipes]|nr:hypothetical protein TNCV_3692651 [Trichonephila clavipes]
MLFCHGSDDTKYKKDRTRIRGENMLVIHCSGKILGSIWLVYAIQVASDDGACAHAVFVDAIAMKLHFACRQSGSSMERFTNAELTDMHLASGAAYCNGVATQWLCAQLYQEVNFQPGLL